MPLANEFLAGQLLAYRTSTDVPADLKARDWINIVLQGGFGDEIDFIAYDINGAAALSSSFILPNASPNSLLALIHNSLEASAYETWATIRITSAPAGVRFAPVAQLEPIGDVRNGAITLQSGWVATTSGINADPELLPYMDFGFGAKPRGISGRTREASVVRAEANLAASTSANHAFEVIHPEADLYLRFTPTNTAGTFTYRIDRVGPTITVPGTPVAFTGSTAQQFRIEGLTPGRYNLFVSASASHATNAVYAELEAFNMG